MKFPIFGLSASVDIRPPPGAWIAELLGVVPGVQDHKKIKFLVKRRTVIKTKYTRFLLLFVVF